MKTAKKALGAVLGLALMGGLAGPQAAASVVTAQNFVEGYTIGGSYNGAATADLEYLSIMEPGTSGYQNALVGRIKLTQSGSPLYGSLAKAPGTGNTPPAFYSVCTDIKGTVYLGTTYKFAGLQMFDGSLNGLSFPWVPNGLQKAAGLFNEYGGTYLKAGYDTSYSAGLQLAIWEALYDSTLGLTTGAFRARAVNGQDGDAITQAGNMLTWLSTQAPFNYDGSMLVPVSSQVSVNNPTGAKWNTLDGAQEMLYFGTDGSTVNVPEPAPMLMGGLAMMLFGLLGVQSLRKR